MHYFKYHTSRYSAYRVTMLISMLLVFVALTSVVQAQPSVFDYPRKAEFVVIEYNQSHAMLLNEDKTPLLRIFGDGRVVVHYPVTMKLAGDYEMNLTDGQIQKLLISLEQNSLMTFNAGTLIAKVKAEKTRLATTTSNTLSLRSDTTNTIINIHLEKYIPGATSIAKNNFSQSIVWANLSLQAKKYSAIPELAGIAQAESILRAYLKNKSLVKTK